MPFLELKTSAEGACSTRSHSHRELSIGFIDKGCSNVICRELEFTMKAGSAILIPPESVHMCEPEDSEIYRFKMLYIDSGWFRNIFDIDPLRIVPVASFLKESDLLKIRSFFDSFAAHEEILKKESDYIYFIEYLIFDVFQVEAKAPPEEAISSSIEKVKLFLDNNFSDAVALNDLESVSGLSKFSLLRKFKKEYKLTPHAYLVNIRINHARELLKQQKAIAEVAAECGFFDQSHFIKTFQHYFAMNPNEYRKREGHSQI